MRQQIQKERLVLPVFNEWIRFHLTSTKLENRPETWFAPLLQSLNPIITNKLLEELFGVLSPPTPNDWLVIRVRKMSESGSIYGHYVGKTDLKLEFWFTPFPNPIH